MELGGFGARESTREKIHKTHSVEYYNPEAGIRRKERRSTWSP